MKHRVLALLACIAIVCSGCASNVTPPPPKDFVPTFPEVGKAAGREDVGSGATLPSSYGPLDQNDKAVRLVRGVLETAVPSGEMGQFSASALQAMTERLNVSPVLVSECDLEVLKIFVVSDWVPVVVVRSPVGPKHIRAIVGYDDSAEQLVLIDPVRYAEMRFRYSEFSKQWADPQKACLLIFQQRVIKETIERALVRYLPEKKVESISIKVPQKR